MANITLDADSLGMILHEIEQGCFMLGFVNDEDDMDDVDYYRERIKRAACDLRELIKKAKGE